jgi:hypothetical protein
LAEDVAHSTHSRAGIVTPPISTGSSVNRSVAWLSGLVYRSSSSTAPGSSDGSERSLASSAGLVSRARAPDAIRLVVVSWPATRSRNSIAISSRSSRESPESRASISAETMSSAGPVPSVNSVRLAATSLVK